MKKTKMEDELRALSNILDLHGVDMNTPLLTPGGFPRADIDVPQIRTTRARIIHLRNDYKNLMVLVEKRVHEHFANIEDSDNENTGETAKTSSTQDSILGVPPTPFAKVNSVMENSPAAQAGLRVGDLIRTFGYVNLSNHDSLRKVGECVQGNEGQTISVNVSRSGEEIELRLIPQRNWGGRGTLGCHILPI